MQKKYWIHKILIFRMLMETTKDEWFGTNLRIINLSWVINIKEELY